jgi:hypothetical protein
MGNLVNLSGAIKTVLEGITTPEAQFVDIQEQPTLEFAGYPAASITPSDIESSYANIIENMRTYSFDVDIFYPIEDSVSNGYGTAYAAMRGLMDEVMDAFDNSNSLADACQILRPTPSVWVVVESGSSVLLSARINLKCATTVQTNNG